MSSPANTASISLRDRDDDDHNLDDHNSIDLNKVAEAALEKEDGEVSSDDSSVSSSNNSDEDDEDDEDAYNALKEALVDNLNIEILHFMLRLIICPTLGCPLKCVFDADTKRDYLYLARFLETTTSFRFHMVLHYAGSTYERCIELVGTTVQVRPLSPDALNETTRGVIIYSVGKERYNFWRRSRVNPNTTIKTLIKCLTTPTTQDKTTNMWLNRLLYDSYSYCNV